MWTPWCTQLAHRMTQATGQDLSEHLYNVLGYDHAEKKVRVGALAENTHPQIRDKIGKFFQFSYPELFHKIKLTFKIQKLKFFHSENHKYEF